MAWTSGRRVRPQSPPPRFGPRQLSGGRRWSPGGGGATGPRGERERSLPNPSQQGLRLRFSPGGPGVELFTHSLLVSSEIWNQCVPKTLHRLATIGLTKNTVSLTPNPHRSQTRPRAHVHPLGGFVLQIAWMGPRSLKNVRRNLTINQGKPKWCYYFSE